MTAFMLMQFMDGILLSRYAPEAIAAVGTAGMLTFLLTSVFNGAAAYTSTLAAHYYGAGRPRAIGVAVWQGVYFATVAGLVLACAALVAGPVFRWVAHEPAVQQYEVEYFSILCFGMPSALLGTALSGFYSGRGDTRTLMLIQVLGIVTNLVLDILLIFGYLGFPRLGVKGAALATVAGQSVTALFLAAGFLRSRYRHAFHTWSGRRFDRDMMLRLVRFGLPSGMRIGIEVFAWSVFLVFVGRIGTVELAASSIAWRINGVAFFPIIGVAEAVRILVGQSQGQGRSAESTRITMNGLLVSEVWMLLSALLFVLVPRPLLALFDGGDSPEVFRQVMDLGVTLLRFVAVYCLLDGFNIVLSGMLQAAGDTRWTLGAAGVMHALFVVALAVADRTGAGLMAEWTAATSLVMVLAVILYGRFHHGAWKNIRVIEPDAVSRNGPVDSAG
jgi:MATE family multidrug resistance protein